MSGEEDHVGAWMPLYVGDYLKDTGALTAEEHGAYLLLLMQSWQDGGRLPSDQRRLAMLARIPAARWPRVWAAIGRFFIPLGDSLANPRLLRELTAAKEGRRKRVVAGRRGAAARWVEPGNAISNAIGNATQSANADAMAKRCPPAPASEEKTTDARVIPGAGAGARMVAHDLCLAFGKLRAEALGGLPWKTPVSADGKATTFAARLEPQDHEDVAPTMSLMFAKVANRARGWDDPRLREDASFAFGAWMSRFSALQEELRGQVPQGAPRAARPGDVRPFLGMEHEPR